ncbi:hypothetical protein QBC34DRAFT_174783 [Podospora aff. communis PSN243]|uniref:Uncharacterized protein n=1 Tax=Podospora aff. communis PSN243 TaxID=3040156 RepID=A0AAV9H4U3_9PEZI|nr:hypothetical protein QBC34DRAFT_174783 [Podospora aff. communis PSN243]
MRAVGFKTGAALFLLRRVAHRHLVLRHRGSRPCKLHPPRRSQSPGQERSNHVGSRRTGGDRGNSTRSAQASCCPRSSIDLARINRIGHLRMLGRFVRLPGGEIAQQQWPDAVHGFSPSRRPLVSGGFVQPPPVSERQPQWPTRDAEGAGLSGFLDRRPCRRQKSRRCGSRGERVQLVLPHGLSWRQKPSVNMACTSESFDDALTR